MKISLDAITPEDVIEARRLSPNGLESCLKYILHATLMMGFVLHGLVISLYEVEGLLVLADFPEYRIIG